MLNITLIRDQDDGFFNGSALILFYEKDGQVKAVEKDGEEFLGRTITIVEKSKPSKKPRGKINFK